MRGCRVLTDEEIRAVLNELGVRDRLLFLTCLTFGTRISEALSLTFRDVEGGSLYIKSEKGSENQSFPIPSNFRREVVELENYYRSKGIDVNRDTPMFLSQKGSNMPITRQLASYIVKMVAGRTGLDGKVNTHSFRKTFVTKIYEMTGFNLAETKNYSRHKSLVNLDSYIKTTEKTDLVEKLCWG